MRLSHITIAGFKSFAKKVSIDVTSDVTGVVGPNGSGKSNVAEAIRFALGEQSMKSMRGKLGTDLIFKGSENVSPSSRAVVTLTIDNKDKLDTEHASEDLAPHLCYDELVLSRTIYGDGTSDYTLNSAKVRLKDVQELLAFAGIGASAHTMISQGEADKILLADLKGRKEAIEDSLGLRVYHIRLNESRRKLDRTKEHMREVDLLRKEIAPHLVHLKKQVEKIESKEKERTKLCELLSAYLKREELNIDSFRKKLQETGNVSFLMLSKEQAQFELEEKKKRLDILRSEENNSSNIINNKNEIYSKIRELNFSKDEVTKSIGRLQGELNYLNRELNKEKVSSNVSFAKQTLIKAGNDINFNLDNSLSAIDLGKVNDAKVYINSAINLSKDFFKTDGEQENDNKEEVLNNIKNLNEEIEKLEEKQNFINGQISEVQIQVDRFDEEMRENLDKKYEEEKAVIVLEAKLRELDSLIYLRKQEEEELKLKQERFDSLLNEGALIVGRSILLYRELSVNEKFMSMEMHELLRSIDRSKFKIEESGIPNQGEIMEEYRSVEERDDYLKKELEDVSKTEEKLLSLISDLENSLETKFENGVKEISKLFSGYFSEVFPNGKASLSIIPIIRTDELGNQIKETGVDIDVSLPSKRVKEISMFSGGERALISIALLFAMSSLLPPPFMVLDETDAPLDETNARKYGQMLERLAEKSKLLVITHNRETMNHCDVLYGVTLGVDGASKLLSISLK